MTTSRSGRHALRRRPISSKPAASRLRWSFAIVSQSRAMIGPWLAANAPTRLAIDLPFPCLERMQPRDKLAFRHAADLEIETHEIGVDQRRDLANVVLDERLADVRLDRVALEHGRHIGAILRRQLGIVLQIEEQLAHPVIGHRPFRFPTASRHGCSVILASFECDSEGPLAPPRNRSTLP